MAFFDNAKSITIDNKEVQKLMLDNKIIFEKGGDEPIDHIVTFTVLDGDDNPVEGASVNLDGITEITGGDGDCRFDMFPGSYELCISATGYEDYTDTLTVVDADTNDVTIHLESLLTVTITVLDASNLPVSGAEVILGEDSGQTNVDGVVVFENIARGTYSLTASAEDSGAGDAGNVTVDEDHLTFSVTLI